uniref:IR76b n=1 Tax=Hycleus phaleratus TaxID=1248972 RepID=A0A2U9NK99_9CUCU|nr:IR76b [Hycleus phaleratus]
MGLIEIVLAGLLLNSTNPNLDSLDDSNSPDSTALIISEGLSKYRLQLRQLANELKNENLIVATLSNEKLSGSRIDRNKRRYGTGIAFELLDILQKKFGFNYTVIVPRKNIWGSEDGGVLTLLKNKEADLSVAFLPVLSQYTDSISYSPSLDTGRWLVLMKRPKESATGEGLLAPFTLPVWLLILVSLFIVGPIIYCLIHLQTKLCKTNDRDFSLPACVWFVYGALLKQGSTLNPISDSARLLFATWWIFITILTAFYTANLTAFLTLSKFTLPITKATDIGKKHLPWVTTKGNALEDTGYMNNRTLGYPRHYLNFTDNYILGEYVNKRSLMFIRETPIIQHTMYDDYKRKVRAGIDEEKRCTYVITTFDVMKMPRAFAYAKNFKYKVLFDKTILHLVEAGIIKYKLLKDLPDTQICPLDLGSKERRLRNSDLIMTYMIVGGGFILALIAFFTELFIRRVIRRNKHQQQRFDNNNNELLKSNRNLLKKKLISPPPPGYYTFFNPTLYNQNVRKKMINGREYWVYEGGNDDRKTMIPLRTPSALLFQFTN